MYDTTLIDPNFGFENLLWEHLENHYYEDFLKNIYRKTTQLTIFITDVYLNEKIILNVL